MQPAAEEVVELPGTVAIYLLLAVFAGGGSIAVIFSLREEGLVPGLSALAGVVLATVLLGFAAMQVPYRVLVYPANCSVLFVRPFGRTLAFDLRTVGVVRQSVPQGVVRVRTPRRNVYLVRPLGRLEEILGYSHGMSGSGI